MPHARTPFRVVVTALAAVALIGTNALAAPAAAHDQLVETSPEEGEIVDVVPAEVMLRFTQPVIDLSARILVRDSADTVVLDVEADVDEDVITAPLPADLADGTYTVSWRVVSADGHPIQGAFDFHVREPSAPSTGPAPTPPTATAGPADGEPAGGPTGDRLLRSAVLAVGVGVGVGAAVVLGLILRRRRTQP
ncbi:copper resistance CopC family protein [Cellulomonas sp. KRMCY2]|uniref:copper resistance CopC family protein n=1 Tax=Cellulomonas sp. KRMCY2 TaxID=1304865 RepID=UPI00045EB7FE|nr:copper resistance CopC family protein [Cellulomonas sp. KRMCY2]